MKRRVVAGLLAGGLWATGACVNAEAAAPERRREPIAELPCENCELVFVGLPETPASMARLAPADEQGEAMRIEGIVLDRDGKPAAGTIVYAYHTDARGIYPRAGVRHGRLRGWAQSDEQGRYRFDTIRPAGYPGTGIPSHVHMHVIEVGRCSYFIDDIVFTDDPRLTPEERRRHDNGRGGSGIVTPRRDGEGRWLVTRDIVLGARITGCPSG